ncbi:MAG: hypothetical protein M3Z54_05025 [Gemmatimonadota bacterium]|nr:hypothetical protein [Gemmatimonadota bacterium]
MPLAVPLDTQRLERLGRHPRQFRASVYQHGREGSSLARTAWILDLDIYAEHSHLVGHNASSGYAE